MGVLGANFFYIRFDRIRLKLFTGMTVPWLKPVTTRIHHVPGSDGPAESAESDGPAEQRDSAADSERLGATQMPRHSLKSIPASVPLPIDSQHSPAWRPACHLEQPGPGRAGQGLRPPRRASSCRVWQDCSAAGEE
jgi:hypothetical protein